MLAAVRPKPSRMCANTITTGAESSPWAPGAVRIPAAKSVNFLNRYRSRLSLVRVDAIGIGHNFALHLRDCRFPVELINVAMACESDPQLGENDPAVRFVNLKACFYQTLADALERDQIEGLTDETTIGQLAGLLSEFDAHGRMKLESKEQARARGVRSPDRADALMLALCKPRQKFEYYSVRDLRRWTSGRTDVSNISITEHARGFRELPYDEDDGPYRSRASRRWDSIRRTAALAQGWRRMVALASMPSSR